MASFRASRFDKEVIDERLAEPSSRKTYCRYYFVIFPKYRRKAIDVALRKKIGGIFRELCR
jgi:hypothetical protein